jgi:hypothetical protein
MRAWRVSTLVALLVAGCGGSEDGSADAPTTPVADAAVSDASSASDAAPPDARPPFSPGDLPGLTLWLDGDFGVTLEGGEVESWQDRGPNGALARSLTLAGRPTPALGGINGHAAIHFNGVDDFLAVPDAPYLQWAQDDFLIAMVVSPASTVGQTRALYNKQDPAAPYPGIFLYTSVAGWLEGKVDATHLVSAGLTIGPHVVVFRRTGASLVMIVDGSSYLNVNGADDVDVSMTGIDVAIGGRYQPDPMMVEPQRFEGDIAEVVAVHGPLDEAVVTELVEHLAEKYGIDLGSS